VSPSSAAGTSLTLKTNGIGFQVISAKGSDRGNAEVWVDGTRRAIVNLYADTVQPAKVVGTIEGLAKATHQVELRALGTRTAPSTANRVDIDGFIALRSPPVSTGTTQRPPPNLGDGAACVVVPAEALRRRRTWCIVAACHVVRSPGEESTSREGTATRMAPTDCVRPWCSSGRPSRCAWPWA
jgi:hypothetical protein